MIEKNGFTILDSSYFIGRGSSLVSSTEGSLCVTSSIEEEIISHHKRIPPGVLVLKIDQGPSLTNFKKADENLMTWSSSKGHFLQLLVWNGRRRADCGKHEVKYQFFVVGLDLTSFLCTPLVEKPDFSIYTAVFINPNSNFRSYDLCLIKSVNKLKDRLVRKKF